jgi:hypothetical protein
MIAHGGSLCGGDAIRSRSRKPKLDASIWEQAMAMKIAILGAGMALSLVADAAQAQDTGWPGLLAVASETLGQTLGDAARGGDAIFVTASGKARLPAPLSGSHFVNVEGKAASAVEAAHQREQRLADARRIAGQFGVDMEVGDSTFRHDADPVAEQAENRRQNAEMQAQLRAHPGEPLPPRAPHEPAKLFLARTGVRFRAPDAARLPVFLDALTAAGIDIGGAGLNSQIPNFLTSTQEVLGFGAVEKIDDAIWDKASQAAVGAAHRQAEVLASAAGRRVGPVRQITLLSRTVSSGEATVSLAARFGYAP